MMYPPAYTQFYRTSHPLNVYSSDGWGTCILVFITLFLLLKYLDEDAIVCKTLLFCIPRNTDSVNAFICCFRIQAIFYYYNFQDFISQIYNLLKKNVNISIIRIELERNEMKPGHRVENRLHRICLQWGGGQRVVSLSMIFGTSSRSENIYFCVLLFC